MSASKYYHTKYINNKYLGVSKEVKGETHYEVEMKAFNQLKKWKAQEERARERAKITDMKERAQHSNSLAEAELNSYINILDYTLTVDDRIKWTNLYDKKSYQKFHFKETEPTYEQIAQEINLPNKSFFEFLLPGRKSKREETEQKAKNILEERIKEFNKRKEEALNLYAKEKNEYQDKQKKHNGEIEQFKADFEAGNYDAIENYARLVLEYSNYPDAIKKEFEVQYDANSQIIIIDYLLPNQGEIPHVTGYKYVSSKKEIAPIEMKQKEFDKFYEGILYQVTLRSIHEIFESIYTNYVLGVVFNGWVEGVDTSTGNDFKSCVLSIQVNKDEFQKINLSRIEPKQCFRSLKGISAGPLSRLAPVRPIIMIKREDVRFIESREVLANVESIPNLASMDWGEFEHLVRELFEKYFAEIGGEVRITRASRDYGVDAIVFDPDPIRGGKIVIQAKRYNNVVPVSAVRDLFGTVHNEGASKGILVTTSYFGNDSREFAKDKPLTLLDGSNLIYLFKQHGYNVRIDLKKNNV